MCATHKPNHTVRFDANVTLVSFEDVAVASDMTNEEKHSTWYTVDEIIAFRNNVRESSRLILQRKCDNSSVHRPQHELLSEYEECGRGLEHRIDPDRQVKKVVASRCIIKYQHRLRLCTAFSTEVTDTESCLANVSARLSQWARDLALITAQEDYIAAYPEMEPFVSVLMCPTPISDSFCRKRKSEATTHVNLEKVSSLCYESERRVKKRMPINIEESMIENESDAVFVQGVHSEFQ